MRLNYRAKRRLYVQLKAHNRLNGVSFLLYFNMYELVIQVSINHTTHIETFYAVKRSRYKEHYYFYCYTFNNKKNKKLVLSKRVYEGTRQECFNEVAKKIKKVKDFIEHERRNN